MAVVRRVHHQVEARERGRRRVAAVSRTVAVGSTALAAVFGVVLAQQPASHASQGNPAPARPAPGSSAPTPAPSSGAVPSMAPPTKAAPGTTQLAPDLQPPQAPPQTAPGSGWGVAGSGGT